MADNITVKDSANADKTLATSEDGSSVHSPKIIFHSAQPTATLTRPNDSNPYVAGDAIADSTSSPTAISFSGCGRLNGGYGVLEDATVVISTKSTVAPELHLLLFDASPTPTNDNAAFAISDADMQTCQCLVIFSPSNMTDGSNNRLYKMSNRSQKFKCGSSTTTLYGLLLTKSDFTPAAQDTFQFDLNITQL